MDYNDFSGMSNEEFFSMIASFLNENDEEKDDNDYEINPSEWAKMTRALELMSDICRRSNGRIEPLVLRPSELHGGVNAYFNLLDLSSDIINEFCIMLRLSNAVTIDANLDGEICVSLNVPNVFRRKQ